MGVEFPKQKACVCITHIDFFFKAKEIKTARNGSIAAQGGETTLPTSAELVKPSAGGSHRTQHTRPRVARATKAGPWEKTLPTAAPQAAAPARDLPLASRGRAPPGSGCAHDRPLLPFPFQLTFSTSAAVQARRTHTDSLQSEGACTGKRAKNRKWLRGSFGPDHQSFSRLRAQTWREGLRAAPCARTHTPAPDFLRKRTSAEPALPQRSARRSARLGSARRGAGNRKGGPLARRRRTELAQGTGPGAPRTAASPGQVPSSGLPAAG